MVCFVLNEDKWMETSYGEQMIRFIYVGLRKKLLCMQELMYKFRGAHCALEGGVEMSYDPSLFWAEETSVAMFLPRFIEKRQKILY